MDKKKKTIYTLVSVAVIIVVLTIVFCFSNTDSKKSQALEAIPDNSTIILKINNSSNFLSSLKKINNIYNLLFSIFDNDYENSLLHFIDSLNNIADLQIYNTEEAAYFSYSYDGKSKLQQLLVIANAENSNYAKLKDKLKKNGQIKTRQYYETEIIDFIPSKFKQKISVSIKNNLLLVSFSSNHIERAIDNLLDRQKSIINDPILNEIITTGGKNETANIYVNTILLNNFISKYYSKNNDNNNINYFSNWMVLDFNYDIEKFNFNGFSNNNDTIVNFPKIVETQEPVNWSIMQILPNNTSSYISLAFNKSAEYDKSFCDYLKQTGKYEEREQKIQEIKKQTGIDIKSTFYKIPQDEICLATTIINENNNYENTFLIFKIHSSSVVNQELDNIIKALTIKLNKTQKSFKEKLEIDKNTFIDCFILPFDNMPELLFGPIFKNCSGKYASCYKNHLIFANSKDALLKFIYDISLNNTLFTNIEHRKFLENFSEKSNSLFYFSFYKNYETFKNMFNQDIQDNLLKKQELIYKLGNFGYQIIKLNNKLYNNIVLKSIKDFEIKSQTTWETTLDTTINIKPLIVLNHNTKTKEILVQDEKYSLYLLTSKGSIIWKIELEEPIIGDIKQIDYYKNNKLQYIFSTTTKIYIIDRLGNSVEKYPITLMANATAPMALFDYDNNKQYRIMIPCEDKKVYLYDINGSPKKDWKFDATENQVYNQICHYQIGNQDFIVFNDKYNAYFLNRRGENRLNFATNFNFSKNNTIMLDNTGDKPRFVCTDEKGTIRLFNIDGSQDSLFIKEFSPNHYFVIKDIYGDNKNEYIFADENKLEVYNNSNKLIFSYIFDSEISYMPRFYSFKEKEVKTGIVCKDDKKVFLLNNDGSLLDGFPLIGCSEFSISNLYNDKKNYLIVAGLNNLLYNYKIND